MADVEAAVEALENLGLTTYEARCFVALTQLPHGTAKEIGQVADIPRSRVYETMDRLREKGLVALHEAEPRMYQSVDIETALRILRSEYESYFDRIETELGKLEPAYKDAAQGVWALNTHEQVTGQVVALLEEAEEEVLLITVEATVVDERTLDALEAATERGVDLFVGTAATPVRERFDDAEVPATVFTTDLIEWFSSMTGSPRIARLLAVDRGPVLASALHEEELPGVPNETAVWTDGVDHGFAVFAERTLSYVLNEQADVTGE